MFYVILTIIAVIVVGALGYYPMSRIFDVILDRVTVPVEMGGAWLDFFRAYVNWYLLIGVLMVLVVWVLYQTMRPKTGYYY